MHGYIRVNNLIEVYFMKQCKVSISTGNSKMGAIPSVSLPACVTCNPDAPCFKECYAVKIARIYKAADAAYKRNLDILTSDPAAYWLQVRAAASMARYFRFHVSGDIPNSDYLNNMIQLAQDLKNTTFLVFTKQYHLINDYLNAGVTMKSAMSSASSPARPRTIPA